MQAMWSTAATPSGTGGTDDVADCRSIVPMLSGISLGVGSSPMERQCSMASRVNHAYSSQQYQLYNGSCDFQDSYGDPYNSHVRPASTTSSIRNGCSSNKYDYYNGLFSCHDVSSTPQIPSQLPNYIDIDSLYIPPSTGGVTNDDYNNHVLNRSSSYRDFRMMQQQQQSATAATGTAAGSGSKENRVCGVCGDKALGYNFDAISCESCKAFFRRNAPKGLEHFKCAYDSNCKMDLSNRRFCKRCRLGKCFEIGMRREYILTDDERAVKRQKIIENRIKRMGSQTASTPTSTASVPTVSEASPGSSISVSSPGSSQSIPPSTGSPVSVDVQPECGLTQIPNCSGNGVAPPVAAVNFVSAAAVASALDDEDTAAIAELVTAYRESLKVTAPTTDPAPQEGADPSQSAPQQVKSNSTASNLSDLVNIAEVSIRRVIAMVKQMRSFRAVAHDDQIQLLKGGTIELLILRSVLTFDPNKQQFLDPHDPEDTAAMKVEQLRYAEQGTDLFEDQMAFVKSLVELTLDETTLILLLVIALFSPDRERINDIQLVANEQERYTILLNRYLESTFSVPVARSLFPKLLHKLADLRDLNEKHSMVLLKVNPDGIQPLMKEVLDIDR